MEYCIEKVRECDFLVVVGTSLSVFPANQLITYVSRESELVIIDPNAQIFEVKRRNTRFLPTIASEGMMILNNQLTSTH